MTRKTIAAGFISFLVLGVAGGSYGQAIVPLRAEYGLNAGEAGSLVTVHSVLALLGVGAYALARRQSFQHRLIAATAIFMVGCALFGAAHTWPLTLAGAALIGFGFGVAGNAYNTRFAVSFGKKSVVMLTLLNAVFGVGALLGPLVIGIIDASNFRTVYVGAAASGVIPLVLLVLAKEAPVAQVAEVHEASTAKLEKIVVAAFAFLLFLEVGIEASAGAWINTHLIHAGVSSSNASFVTGGFWAAMAIGRVAVILVTRRLSESQIIVVSSLSLVPLYALASVGHLGVIAYVIAGLLMAPLFPCVMTWAARRTNNADHVGTLLFAMALVGGGVVPVLVGKTIDLTSPRCVPVSFAVISLVFLLVTISLYRSRDRGQHPETVDVARNSEFVI
jgi:fucose permease